MLLYTLRLCAKNQVCRRRELARLLKTSLRQITHDPKVRAITDRVMQIRDGRILNSP
jgi:ABC-type lipoprotein export system ATPase subunit